jgi:hypothetical protein
MKLAFRAVLLGALVLSSASPAAAFCRARTCDPSDLLEDCQFDENDCVVSGRELFWASSCVTFSIHEGGSPALGIEADTLERVATNAFRHWLEADCGGGTKPSIHVGSTGSVVCNASEYNERGRNANIVIFRDDEWPYPGSPDAFGYTLLSFDSETGAIYDADIELNSAEFELSATPDQASVDLESVLTHEIGHFLGIAHTAREHADATMSAGWDGVGSGLRSLSPDDQDAICAIYPPEERTRPSNCEPRHGFASECGVPLPEEPSSACSFAGHRGRGSPRSGQMLALATILALLTRQRARRSRERQAACQCRHAGCTKTGCAER